MKSPNRAPFVFGFLLAFVVSIPAQPVLAPLPVEDLFAAKSFAGRSPIDLSPDGEWLAYVLYSQAETNLITDPRYNTYSRTGVGGDGDSTSVWITNVKSGESKRLLDGASSWGVSWSPNGRWLAFYSDKSGQTALWVWDKTNASLRQVSKEITRTFFGYEVPQWTPDSRRVLVKLLPEGLTLETAADLLVGLHQQKTSSNLKLLVYSSTQEGSANDPAPKTARPKTTTKRSSAYLSDLALIEISSGNVRRLAKECAPTAYFLSPDASRVVYMESLGREMQSSQQLLYDISMVSTSDGTVTSIAKNIRMNYGTSVSWSADGKLISYVTAGPLARGDCFVVEVSSGKVRNLTEGAHPPFGANHYRPPLWNVAGDKIYCIGAGNVWEIPLTGDKPRQVNQRLEQEITGIVAARGKGFLWTPFDDSHPVYVTTRDNKTKQTGFYKIDLPNGQATKLIEENKDISSPVFNLDISENGRDIVYLSQDGEHCADVWMNDPNLTKPRRITNTNPKFDKYLMGKTQLIEWNSDDGEKLQGTLLLPASYVTGNRYPLIVDVYGGNMASNFVNRFGAESTGASFGIANTQLLATRGYAVFLPDMPLKVGTPMRDIAKIVLPGINKIIELGIADPDRLGVKGVSYGGYCTLALITQTTRFKAALVRSSAGANLFSFYGTMGTDGSGPGTGWAERGQGAMGGTPWQFRDRYIENSPIFYFDRITTPVMIMAGTEDTATPAFLSDEIFVSLQRLGKEAMYVKYKGGEHGESSLDNDTAIDYFNRTIAWFDKYLKTPARTESTKQ